MLNVVHKDSVLLNQFGIFKVFQLEQRICDGVLRHSRIQTTQSGVQFFFVERTVKIPVHIGTVDIAVTHVLEQFYDGILVVRFGIKS